MDSLHDEVLAALNARSDAALDAGDRAHAREIAGRMLVVEFAMEACQDGTFEGRLMGVLRRRYKNVFRRVDEILGVARPPWWACGRARQAAPEVSVEDMARAIRQAVLDVP